MAVAAVRFRRLPEESEGAEEMEGDSRKFGTDSPQTDPQLDGEAVNASDSYEVVIEDGQLEKEYHLRKTFPYKCRKCCSVVKSWKTVMIGLIAFAAAMGISLVIYELVKEPSPPFYPGGCGLREGRKREKGA